MLKLHSQTHRHTHPSPHTHLLHRENYLISHFALYHILSKYKARPKQHSYLRKHKQNFPSVQLQHPGNRYFQTTGGIFGALIHSFSETRQKQQWQTIKLTNRTPAKWRRPGASRTEAHSKHFRFNPRHFALRNGGIKRMKKRGSERDPRLKFDDKLQSFPDKRRRGRMYGGRR